MSMLRAPDPESSIKGNTGNFPFWPGGLDVLLEDTADVLDESVGDASGTAWKISVPKI